MRGYQQGRFSFNVKGGRCEACSGDGTIKIEMNFLPDVYVPCEVCHGARYNRETLEVHYKGKTIAEVLDMPIEEAVDFFAAVPAIARHMKTLVEVGLGYVRLGQPATDAVRRRGAAGQAVLRAAEAVHRPHRLRPRRADHRPALRGHPQAAAGARPAGRPGQHRAGHRAQPRRHQDRRLAGRHGSRGRLARRPGGRRGHAGGRSRPTRTATPAQFLKPLLDGRRGQAAGPEAPAAKAPAAKRRRRKTAAKKATQEDHGKADRSQVRSKRGCLGPGSLVHETGLIGSQRILMRPRRP